MSKNKVKFQPVTLVLSKQQLKGLHTILAGLSYEEELKLLGYKHDGALSSIFDNLEDEMNIQGLSCIEKNVVIKIK